MQDSLNVLERLLQWLLLPASIYGAGGALLHSARKGKGVMHTIVEALGGVITTNAVCPLIQDATPEKWHYTFFFLAGWGGLELVSRIYEAAVSALEQRIRRQLNPRNGEE